MKRGLTPTIPYQKDGVIPLTSASPRHQLIEVREELLLFMQDPVMAGVQTHYYCRGKI